MKLPRRRFLHLAAGAAALPAASQFSWAQVFSTDSQRVRVATGLLATWQAPPGSERKLVSSKSVGSK